ncbi:hypothetical protein BJF83_20850 [Nocardiopsis sp. CNR-923]|uniref:hypothetical protein n=1 Tax=Nocardiopsis sp. CNR-923 TaxID=1904965 RepID=UPI00095E87DB|nr:hypothetical protein [Nocardiopsis sp. CNR-923]OLT26537.1 hypothetical protein BJF83_20850 [Nocardiopsis sp. CNR-923]
MAYSQPVPTGFLPTTTRVAIDWLKTIPGLPAEQINTALPTTQDGAVNYEPWVEHGFVQVGIGAGGGPMMDLPVNEPVVTLTCWAASLHSKKPQWGKANDLAVVIIHATYERRFLGPIATRPGYEDVRVFSAYATGDPLEVQGESSHHVGYEFDLALRWVRDPAPRGQR